MNWTEIEVSQRERAQIEAERKPRKPRAHPERDLERACSDLLQFDGWRTLKTDPCSDRARGKGFGEKGMADCQYRRYNSDYRFHPSCLSTPLSIQLRAQTETMWIEWKSFVKRKVPRHQLNWHAAERAHGALTLIAGQDFPATLEGFLEWYRSSGLMRRKI